MRLVKEKGHQPFFDWKDINKEEVKKKKRNEMKVPFCSLRENGGDLKNKALLVFFVGTWMAQQLLF